MNTNFNLKSTIVLAATAAFLMVPGVSHAACAVSAASALPYTVPATGLVSTVAISAPAGCPWTFTARGSAWIRILSATSGSGPAVVTYQILPNTTGRVRTFPFGPIGVAATSPVIAGRSTPASGGSSGFTITVTQNAH